MAMNVHTVHTASIRELHHRLFPQDSKRDSLQAERALANLDALVENDEEGFANNLGLGALREERDLCIATAQQGFAGVVGLPLRLL